MDTGNVLELFRDRISKMSGDDITFLFNNHLLEDGEKLVFEGKEQFVLEISVEEDFQWEISWDDITEILLEHGIPNNLDLDRVLETINIDAQEYEGILGETLKFDGKKDKIACGKSMIEDVLIKDGCIGATKLFPLPKRD